MQNRRSILDFPRNEAGLVDEFIGTAFDAVYQVYIHLAEVINSKNNADRAEAAQKASEAAAVASVQAAAEANASAVAAAASATNLAQAVSEAVAARDEAELLSLAAATSAESARLYAGGFLPSSVEAPTARVDGSPLQIGDRYFNTNTQAEYIYKNTGWVSNDSLLALDELSEELQQVAAKQVKQVSSYTELREYSGPQTVQVVSPGIAGFFEILPPGEYVDDGGITFITSTGKARRRVFTGPIDIAWFSPVNNGVASDAAAINAALLANHNRGGGAVVGDAMLWRLGETIHYGKNTSLFLNAKARLVRGHAGDVFRNDIGVTSSTTGYAGNGNIEVWGGQWEGNPAEFYKTFSFLQIGNADRVTFKHSTFLDTIRSHVADLSAVRNVLFEDCYFLGFAGAASSTETTPASAFIEALQVDPNIPSSFPFGARDGTASSNITVRRCKFGPNPAQADSRFGSWGCAIGQHGSLHDQFMRSIRVEDCEFDGITYSAIRGMRWVDVWIERNTFKNCRRGVHVTPIPYNSSSANTAAGTPSGVGQSGRNWNLKGNTYDGFTDNAIVFAEVSAFNADEEIFFHEDVTIDGETFRNGPNNSAIALRYCSGAKVGTNRYENVLRGVDLDCSRDSSVKGANIAGVLQQFCTIREDYLVSGKASPSRNNSVSGATGANVGREFVRVECPAKDTNVFGNEVSGVCNANGGLAAVAYYAGAQGGLVVGNTLKGNDSVKPSYGIYVNSTASGVSESGNLFEYTVQAVSNNGVSKPPVSLGPVSMDVPQIGAYGTGVLQFGHWAAGVWSPKLQLSSAGNLTPLTAGTYNIGSATLPFSAVFANQMRVGPAAATQVSVLTGSASPEGAQAANPGSLYMQLNGTVGKLWVKESGTSNTGWVGK